jgi:hypothetical protein
MSKLRRLLAMVPPHWLVSARGLELGTGIEQLVLGRPSRLLIFGIHRWRFATVRHFA